MACLLVAWAGVECVQILSRGEPVVAAHASCSSTLMCVQDRLWLSEGASVLRMQPIPALPAAQTALWTLDRQNSGWLSFVESRGGSLSVNPLDEVVV